MAYTAHGHQIQGTPVEGAQPKNVARCGGPRLCSQCSREAAYVQSEVFNQKQQEDEIISEIGYLQGEPYQETARRLVYDYAVGHLHRSDVEKGIDFTIENVFVVWFAKTLQNWKCLVSTTLLDGMYYEVTFNGDKREAYLDAYKKFDNCVYTVESAVVQATLDSFRG